MGIPRANKKGRKCQDCGKSLEKYVGSVRKYCDACACIHKSFHAKKRMRKYLRKIRKDLQNCSLGLRFRVFERDEFRCIYCGNGPGDGRKLVVDHLYPKSKGGQDIMKNLVTACEECNLGKGDRIIYNRFIKKGVNKP